MTETQTTNNWLEDEAKALNEQNTFDGEKLPSLMFEENKIVKFTIDFSKPFGTWEDKENHTTKAIISVVHEGVKKNLWLNKKNPLYKDLVLAGKEGKTEFSVLQTGNKANTKYTLVSD